MGQAAQNDSAYAYGEVPWVERGFGRVLAHRPRGDDDPEVSADQRAVRHTRCIMNHPYIQRSASFFGCWGPVSEGTVIRGPSIPKGNHQLRVASYETPADAFEGPDVRHNPPGFLVSAPAPHDLTEAAINHD